MTKLLHFILRDVATKRCNAGCKTAEYNIKYS